MRSFLLFPIIVIFFFSAKIFGASTPPDPLDKPYAGGLWALYGDGCAGLTTNDIANMANRLSFVNAHSFQPTDKFWFSDDCPKDAKGRTIKQQILALNPNFTFSNYRNGSYTNQDCIDEAAESEQRFPMGISVWDTKAKLTAWLNASNTNFKLTRSIAPPSGVTEQFYPFKESKTTAIYSVDKNQYVSWVRIEDEIMRINSVSWDGTNIVMDVTRGIWGTTAASHTISTRVMAPVYIGSVKSGADTSLSGVPDNGSPQMGIRYAYYQQDTNFQTWLGDKAQHYFDKGCDVTWLDVTASTNYNTGDAYGQARDPWDYESGAAVSATRYMNYQQQKINALYARFPDKKFFVNNVKGESYFPYEKRFLTGENASGQKVNHPVDGGCMEYYVGDTETGWHQDVDMTLDMVANQFWTIAWAKGGTAQYRKYAYATYLLAYAPGCKVVFGSEFGIRANVDSYFYYDLGNPIETYTNSTQATNGSLPVGIYQRHFSKGMVLVNVKSTTATVALTQALFDVDSSTFVNSVDIAGKAGKILLKSKEDMQSFANPAWGHYN